jgi:Fe-S oxidoreductase
MSLLKAELVHARIERHGLTWQQRVVSMVDLLGQAGCIAPGLANWALKRRSIRYLLARIAGISARRPLPLFAGQRFDKWFSRVQPSPRGTRGTVLLWDDTFVRYHEPHIGIAAVRVLTAAGFEVRLVRDRVCCGRPAFSQGHLARVERLGRHNLELLRGGNEPILFLEPSCYSMFKEDYRELKLPGAQQVADRCWLFEAFMDNLLRREPNALPVANNNQTVAIHAHCHAKALVNTGFMSALVSRLPGRKVQLLNTGCCGMAGAFGATEAKYDLSLKVAQPLVDALGELSPQTAVVASGTSCRQQIQHLTAIRPKHMAELLAEALG